MGFNVLLTVVDLLTIALAIAKWDSDSERQTSQPAETQFWEVCPPKYEDSLRVFPNKQAYTVPCPAHFQLT